MFQGLGLEEAQIDGYRLMFLTPTELVALTDKVRPGWQARVLDAMAIPYRKRPDGTLVVLRAHVEYQQDRPSREPQMRLDA